MKPDTLALVSVLTISALSVTNLVMLHNVKTDVSSVKTEISAVKTDVAEIQQAIMYRSNERIKVSADEFNCLAKNIFHEAGVEDYIGKVAVAQITMNRLNRKKWGDSICDVVYAKSQFSWTNVKKRKNSAPKGTLWNESRAAAESYLMRGFRVKGLEDAVFYHAHYVNPKWANPKKVVTQIGEHIFYDSTGV